MEKMSLTIANQKSNIIEIRIKINRHAKMANLSLTGLRPLPMQLLKKEHIVTKG